MTSVMRKHDKCYGKTRQVLSKYVTSDMRKHDKFCENAANVMRLSMREVLCEYVTSAMRTERGKC